MQILTQSPSPAVGNTSGLESPISSHIANLTELTVSMASVLQGGPQGLGLVTQLAPRVIPGPLLLA